MKIETNIKFLVCLGILVNMASAADYTAGHGDLGLGEGTELELHLHLGGEGEAARVDGNPLFDTEYEPDEVTIIVPASAQQVRPAAAAWNPLGIDAGEAFWIIPESETNAEAWGTPFLGIGAGGVTKNHFDDNELTLTLKGVAGPGEFALYNLELGVPDFVMSGFDDGITDNDQILLDLDERDHAHYNIAFTEPGSYQIDFEVSATVGGNIETDRAAFTFAVVPEPVGMTLLGLGALVIMRRHR